MQSKTNGRLSGGIREYVIIVIVLALFVTVSLLSFFFINHMQGNARVVNYVGIVRGATQKLVKEELMGYPDDALITRLDGIVNELITGEGPNNLIVLDDEDFMSNMREVRLRWEELKSEIEAVRQGGGNQRLYDLSQDYFTLADKTVSSAELYSEKQVVNTTNVLLILLIAFVALMIGGSITFIRSAALRRKADALDKIAYIDRLTQIDSRAACERLEERYRNAPPEGDTAVFIFDMNNLKAVNDQKGHQGGDKLIADFARIIKSSSGQLGFTGRYGGDEFLVVFENATRDMAENYLANLNEQVVAYNLVQNGDIEKISFAVGYCISDVASKGIDGMIDEADRRMYVRKRQMKENREL